MTGNWIITSTILVTILNSYLCDEGTYLVLLPKSIRPCVDYTFTAQALSNQRYNVTATLENRQGTIYASTSLIEVRSSRKINLKPPCNLTRSSYYVNIVGTGGGAGGVNFKQRNYVSFYSQNLEIIIQTDKKVYKPGQTVKYRIFAVKPNLQVETAAFEVTVTDPRQNKIQFFNRAGDSYGVVEHELILSSEPIFGVWSIKAATGSSVHTSTFSIEKYVLPKAEAKAILPSFVAETDKSVLVKVSSLYTFGKPVQGSAVVRVKVDYYSTRKYQRNPETNKYEVVTIKQPDLLYDLQLKDGEASVQISLEDLRKISNYQSISYKTIVAQANVTDKETGVVYVSKPSSTSVKRTREKIQFALNPKNYKPGLTNTFYVELRQQDGKPVVNPGEITVTARFKYEIKTTSTSTTTTTTQTPLVSGPPVTMAPPIEKMIAYPFHPYPSCEMPQYSWTNLPAQNLSVPANGLARYDLLVANVDALDVILTARYSGNKAVSISQTLSVTRSPSNTFISITLKSNRPTAGQRALFDITATQNFKKFYFTIMSRGSIVYSGYKGYRTAAKVQEFRLYLRNTMAPKLRIVVYIRGAKDEIVADAISFNVAGVFRNKVSLSFNEKKVETGVESTLSVKAYRYSNVYAVAVDKSTTLLGAATDDHSQDVQDFLTQLDTAYTPYYGWGGGWGRGGMVDDMVMFRKKRAVNLRKKREAERLSRHKRLSIWWPYPFFTSGVDAEDMFRNTGVHVITDAFIYKYVEPRTCHMYYPMMMKNMEMAAAPAPLAQMPAEVDSFEDGVATRSYFPETWIWDSKRTGRDGVANFTLKVPDTITSWLASAFAISKYSYVGVGLTSEVATLTVFREFFASLNLPYSVIRGEEVRIQATVFNYLGVDTVADVILENPKGFIILKIDDEGYQYETKEQQTQQIKVASDGTASAFFTVRFVEVGNIDIQVYARTTSQQAGDRLVRSLLVEPEGIPTEYNEVVLVDLSEVKSFKASIPIKFPFGVIPDSQRIVITAYGDPMGSALNNLQHLIRRPGGCGEQNMLGFVPNIYALRYLETTGQLTPSLKNTIKSNLQTGYTTQLRYQRLDKSFSAFGDRDSSGSQWLTAYVLRTFSESREYIYIDENILSNAARYMITNQQEDGSFIEPGRVIHKELRGSSFQGDALTAFTLLALVEVKDKTVTSNAIDHAVKSLVSASAKMDNAYNLAITAYALTKAGSLHAADVMKKLEAKQTSKDGHVYWNVVIDADRVQYFWNPPHKQSSPVNIEATAYALLYYAAKKDVLRGLPVMSWLISQQNGNGGYSSSQDTIVAIQALSQFASLIYGGDWNLQLILHACRQVKSWSISKTSATIQRKWVTSETTDSIDITATGSGRAVVMATVKYNVAEIDVKSDFGLTVGVISETLSELNIEVCTHWRVKGGASGMATMEVGLPSGFRMDESNLKNIEFIKRKETAARKFTLYFDEIGNKPLCVKLRLEKSEMIGKVKPAYVTVTDYYNPDNSFTVSYSSSLAEHADVCAFCLQGQGCSDCPVAKKR